MNKVKLQWSSLTFGLRFFAFGGGRFLQSPFLEKCATVDVWGPLAVPRWV